jgi:TonB family protein
MPFHSPSLAQTVEKARRKRRLAAIFLGSLVLIVVPAPSIAGQQTPQPAAPQSAPSAASPAPSPVQATPVPEAAAPVPDQSATDPFGAISEEALRRQLVGKPLFLRGGYLGDSLSFTEHGEATGHPATGSYTLSAVQIDKVRLTKHRVELEGARYALHFLGALPSEDPSKDVDRIKITPKKKTLKISIDREQVVKPKKVKEAKKDKKAASGLPAAGPGSTEPPVASSETDVASAAQTTAKPAPNTPAAGANEQAETPDTEKGEAQAADQASVTSTISPAHAAKVLHDALDRIFSAGLDDKLRAQMPDFWQLYYQAQAAGADYRPHDPKAQRSGAVDQHAKVTSSIAPDSNEYAQASGIAGPALYRAVIGEDGKTGEIAVVRPIGFGLDENAVAAIQKASFQPAMKGGQPVAETLDLAVVFRIYSKRTSVAASEGQTTEPAKPVKPGPYSAKQPQPNTEQPKQP